MGVLITLQPPTRHMCAEASTAGTYHSAGWNRRYPRLQIITIEDLMEGKEIAHPPSRQVSVTFRKAQKLAPAELAEQIPLLSEVAQERSPYIVKKRRTPKPGRP